MAIEDSPMWSRLCMFRDMMLVERPPEYVQAIRRLKVSPGSYFKLIHQREREHLSGYPLPGASGMEAFGLPLERGDVPDGELVVEMSDGPDVVFGP